MTPIHILFAKMLVKMFHMSLKYIYLLHVSTLLGHLQVTFFFKESIALHTLSLVLLSMPLCIYLWWYMMSPLPISCTAPVPFLRIECNAVLCFSYHMIRTVLVSFVSLFKASDPLAIIPRRSHALSKYVCILICLINNVYTK
jgi:hypothetical protein